MTTIYLKNLTAATQVSIMGNDRKPDIFIDVIPGDATVRKEDLIGNSTFCNKVRQLITAGTIEVRLNDAFGAVLATTDIDDIQAGVDIFPDPISVVTAQYFVSEYNNGNSGAAKTINWANGNHQRITLTANCAITFSGLSGPFTGWLKVAQDAVGGFAITWPAGTFAPGGAAPALTVAPTSVDIIEVVYDGVACHVENIITDTQVIP
jgi:hypothetical protein